MRCWPLHRPWAGWPLMIAPQDVRALDLGKRCGDRANPSPTRPPDLYAIPAISLATVPQQRQYRDCKIIQWGEARSASSFIICLYKQCSFTKLINVLHVHLLVERQAECRALSLGGRNRGAGFRSQKAGRHHTLHLIHLRFPWMQPPLCFGEHTSSKRALQE